MKRKFFGFLGAVLVGVAALTAVNTFIAPTEAMAATPCTGKFLGFKAWYEDLDCEGSNIVSPEGEAGLKKFIWTIVLNVSFDLSLAIGYIALAMVIYGGYLYIMSNGDPGRAAKAQKTLTTAITGVIIAMGATVIVNTILTILSVNGSYDSANAATSATFTAEKLKNAFNWAYSMAGLVAAIFIVKGGIDYTLSRGDPSRTQKATRSLIFAAVGLVVVILAAAITSFVISNVGGAVS